MYKDVVVGIYYLMSILLHGFPSLNAHMASVRLAPVSDYNLCCSSVMA